MTGFLLRFVANTLALFLVSKIVPGVSFSTITVLVVASIVLGLLNAIVKPVLFWLTLPLTIVTLGLFLIILNGVIIALAAWLVPGFDLASFWSAIFAGVLLGLVSLVTNRIGREES